jgi:iron complex outermembrane receptor protein
LNQHQLSQEVQLLGKSFDNRLNWIIGGYYFHESGNDVNLLDFTVSSFRSGGRYSNESLAAFTQGSFDFNDMLSLTAGVRYTKDIKSFTPDQVILQNKVPFLAPFNAPFFAAGTPLLPNVTAKRKFSEVTPMVNLSFKPDKDVLTYATFSRGFKSGGFSQRVFPPIVFPFTTSEPDPVKQIPSFNPEKVTAYEIGVKYTTPSGLLRVNTAAFISNYSDLQIQVFTSVAPVTQNAASARVKGFETEIQLRPGAGWFAEAAVGLTDAHYKSIDFATTLVNSSNAFERISKWTVSAGIQKKIEFDGGSSLTPRLDWSYRSKFFNDAFNTPQIAQAGYHLFDVNTTWRSASEKFSIAANVKNIFNKRFLISGDYGDAFQVYEGVYNRGREASVTVGVKF